MSWLKNLFKSKLTEQVETSYASLAVDLHSHLIPGIDDGAQTLEESLRIIRQMRALGFTHIITTPHVLQEFYPNSSERIRQGEALVQQAIEEDSIDVQFRAAAEYYLDSHFLTLLQAKDLLTLDKANRLLVETSTMLKEPRLHNYIFQINAAGYRPVLAHPERCSYYPNPAKKILEIKSWGCELQLNIGSIVGNYGPQVRKIALKLLQANAYDFVASDAHNLQHIDMLEKGLTSKKIQQLLLQASTFKNKILF